MIRWLVAVIGVAAAVPCGAQVTISTIDSAGVVGEAPSMTIGGDGLALISYHDTTNDTLKVAHCEDAACTSAALATIDTGGDVSAIGTGADGLGIVAYHRGGTLAVKVAHCVDAACTSASIRTLGTGFAPGLAVGIDGLAVVAWISGNAPAPTLNVVHCSDAACSTSTSTAVAGPSGFPSALEATTSSLGRVLFGFGTGDQMFGSLSVAHCDDVLCASVSVLTPVGGGNFTTYFKGRGFGLGADGKALMSYLGYGGFPIPTNFTGTTHCQDDVCSAVNSSIPTYEQTSFGVDANGRTLLALTSAYSSGTLGVAECVDLACSGLGPVLVIDQPVFSWPALRIGQDALPLIAYQESASGDLKVAHCETASCLPPTVSVSDATVAEGDSGTASVVFSVTLDRPGVLPVSVDFATSDGTAVAPGDYAPVAGTLSFAPGVTAQTVAVLVAGDTTDEPDETFNVNLSNATNALLADGQGNGTILNDDPLPRMSIGDAVVLEGDAGTVDASMTVSLSNPSSSVVGVDWQTDVGGGATATPGVDFLAASGSVAFAPGEVSRIVTASVFGDSIIEPDEFFYVRLQNPTNATLDDDLGLVTISDDDAPSLSFDELVHGSIQRQDLAAQPGPVADRDYFRLGQPPRSSWEVVVDGASGDVVPLILERLAADNVTVLQTGASLSGGSSVSLRWPNDTDFPVSNQHLSVRSGGCGATCDPSAVYRIRSYETTGGMARFNNSATQVTVVLLENTGSSPVLGTLWFWGPGGALLESGAFNIAPHASYVLNTATVAPLVGASGSITVTHDARYGDLRGKAVAVEPASGFTFDTAVTFRPR